MTSTIRLAIISDLHCHVLSDFTDHRAESFLVADSPRIPSGRHPVQALIDLIRRDGLRADALVCPGDLAHKASNLGLHSSFAFIKEIASELQAEHVVIATGNHDVDSRKVHGDPFQILKTLHPDFPFRKSDVGNRYWTDGFHSMTVGDRLDIVVINTAYHHYSEPEARHGTFPESQLEALTAHLDERDRAASRSRIAVLHHHPVLHSAAGFESSDVLPNGDRLLECLFGHGCRLVVHGHKHHARLQRQMYGGHHGLVFASGSFSAHLNEIGTHTGNLFHVVTLESSSPIPTGLVHTWEFNFCVGWRPTTIDGSGMPYVSAFGPPPPVDWEDQVTSYLVGAELPLVTRGALVEKFPFLSSCVPDELALLSKTLKAKGFAVFNRDEEYLAAVGPGPKEGA